MEYPPRTTGVSAVSRPGEAIVAGGVLLAVLLLILPALPLLLDLLLAANILVSTLLLLLVLPLRGPLELPSFPSLLLVTGLVRIGLVIAAARLIIAAGTGGALIEVLGSIVSGGSWVAGAGALVVLSVVQIAVITAGAGRAAEVAARFSLDALPGKQFGIDSSLSAKAIDARTAEEQRQRLQAEADFYGAMDGATKFARGEAIACVAVVALTFVAGAGQALAAGGLGSLSQIALRQSVLAAGEAATILVPGLMTCYAAALMVTKGAGGAGLAADLSARARGNTGALWVVAALLALLGFLARPPSLPLLAGAALSALWAVRARRGIASPVSEPSARAEGADASAPTMPAFAQGGLSIRLGLGLIGLLRQGPEGGLFERAREVKQRVSRELRVPLPALTVTDDPSLPMSTYAICCHGQDVARGRLMMSRVLVTTDGSARLPPGPSGPRDAVWADPDGLPKEREAARAGWSVQTPCAVVLEHFERTLRAHVGAFIGRDVAHMLVEQVRGERPVLVAELERAGVGLGRLRQVMAGLCEEAVPLADPAGILEAVADRAAQSDGVADLIEAARRVLAPTITRMCASADGAIDALTLGPNAERYIREARESADPGEATALPVKAIATLRAQTDGAPGETVLLCTPEARRSIRAALGDSRPDLKVISSEEIVGSARVRVVAQVDIPADVLDEGARPRVRADGTDGEIP